MIANDPFTEMATRHDVALFDAELARLPEKYRAPIVLHHLEGKSQRDVAVELGLTEGAVDGLLKRGRNELRIRLARQGVVFGVTLVSVQSAQAAVAATSPQTLIDATVQGMLAFDPVLHPAATTTSAVRLANQEISTMGLMQATKITAWTLVGSLLLGAAGVGVSTVGRDLSLNAAGMVASKLAVAQLAADPPAELAASDSSAEPVPNDATNGKVSDAENLERPSPIPAAAREGKLSDDPIIKKLNERIGEISFVDTSFRDAIDYLGEQFGFKTSLDDATLRDDGTNTNQPVNLELNGVTLRSGLKLLLEPRGLDYIIEDEVLKIVSKKAAENHQEMRIYKLPDRWLEWEEGFQALVKDAVGGDWKQPGAAGAGGTMKRIPQGLAVKHNQRTLLAVEQILARLANAADKPQPSETKSAQNAPPPVSEKVTPRSGPLTGLIRHIESEKKLVWVNLGSDDGIRPRLTLKIPGPQPNNPKGKIEIVRVIDKHMSEAKIIEETLSPGPIKVNDRVEAPLHIGERIAIVGDIDLDGDGKSDRQKLYRLLMEQGMSIDVEVDDDGNRAGKALTESTKFLVLGEIPALRGAESPQARMAFENMFANLKDLRKEARLAGIRIINLNSLLEYIGQPPVKRTAVAQADSAPVSVRKSTAKEKEILDALKRDTQIAFVDTSLRDALDYLENVHKLDILINESEITGDGGSVDQSVNLELNGVKLESALNRMLEPLELDYVIKDEVLMITSINKASEWLELRVYPRSLLTSVWGDIAPSNEAAEEKLLKSIQEAVSGTWKTEKVQNGGTMSLTSAGLVVRQNQRTHREIANLLEQLRKANSSE